MVLGLMVGAVGCGGEGCGRRPRGFGVGRGGRWIGVDWGDGREEGAYAYGDGSTSTYIYINIFSLVGTTPSYISSWRGLW